MPARTLLEDLVRGDMPLARLIFGDERKRRLIPQLQRDGWPIFDLAGKRCAFRAELRKAARQALRKGRATRKGRRSKTSARWRAARESASKAEAEANAATQQQEATA